MLLYLSDTQMQHSTKRESGQPASSPQKKAKAPAPGNQMPAPSGSSSRNHLGGDVPVSISSTSKPKDPKPDDNSDDDETDPQAGPSSGPPIHPVDENDEQQNQNEGNNDEKSDTLEYNSAPEGITDSDDTVDYQDLVINDDASWSLLTQEQKICSNTGSFSIPRYIDNSPVDVMHVRSSNSYDDRLWTYSGQKHVRRNYSDITEVYDHLTPEDSAFMTLYQSLDKSSLLVGKKRKEATQQEKRELAKQFLEAKRLSANHGLTMMFLNLLILGRYVSETLSKEDRFLQLRRTRMVTSLSVKPDGYSRVSKINKRIPNRLIVQPLPDQDLDVQLSKPLILVGTSIIWILRQLSSKEKHMMRPVTSFGRFQRNVDILHTWALG